jgi:ABC-type glycerol-3-phosphate transport system substrate-binding protein
MKKFLMGLTATLVAALMLAGCGGGGGSNDPTAAPTQAPAANTPAPTRAPDVTPPPRPLFEQFGAYQETLMDLGGREIVFVNTNHGRWNWADNPDETINDTIEVLHRIAQIEIDYNCKIIVENAARGNATTDLKIALKATGDVLGDMFAFATTDVGTMRMFQNNLVIPVHDPRIVDVIKPDTNPWLEGSGLTTVRGVQHGVHFLTQNNGDIIRACVLFNRDLLQRFNFDNPYEMVRNRTWTWENFESMLRTIVSTSPEITPVSRITQFNIWGHAFVYSNGGRFSVDTPTGYQFVGHEDEATLAALTFIQTLIADNLMVENFYTDFIAGQSAFGFTIYNDLRGITTQRLVNDLGVIGLLPYPLGPEAIANNLPYGAVTHHVESFYVAEGIQNPEQIAAIIVAFANRLSRDGVIEHELNFNLRDEPSGDMLEIMLLNHAMNPTELVGGAATITNVINLSQTPRTAMESAAPFVQANYDAATGIRE